MQYFADTGVLVLGDGKAVVAKDAAFSANGAAEVAGKTFAGKWSDKFTATITFGADGKASMKFSDGDTATGAYLANGTANAVVYNHRGKG